MTKVSIEKNKKKILFIHHATGWGGAPKSMIQVIKALDKEKYNVHVLLIKDSIVSEKLEESNISYSIAQSKFYKKYYRYFIHSEAGYVKWYQIIRFIHLSILWLLSRFFFAPQELRNHKADIVHLNSSTLTDWLAPAKQKGKVIIHIREPFRNGKIDIIAFFFRRQIKKYADRIIAISKDNARRINIPHKTTVFYNFVESGYTPVNSDSYYSKKCLYVGGGAKIKGFFTLVDALDYLDNDVIVYFAGNYSNSSGKKGIKRLLKKFIWYRRNKAIQKIKQHPNAKYLGLVHNVSTYIDETCCLISPLTKPHFSKPVIEAFFRKKPVIVSDISGMKEEVDNGSNGIMIPVGNSKELAKAINKLANNPQLAMKMGERGYKEAILKYSEKNISILQEIYKALC
ncbi:glycosyltransferase family 4 protein [Calditrichota bacterium LG25]